MPRKTCESCYIWLRSAEIYGRIDEEIKAAPIWVPGVINLKIYGPLSDHGFSQRFSRWMKSTADWSLTIPDIY